MEKIHNGVGDEKKGGESPYYLRRSPGMDGQDCTLTLLLSAATVLPCSCHSVGMMRSSHCTCTPGEKKSKCVNKHDCIWERDNAVG